MMTFEAVSPRGDELLPFDEGVGESVVEGPTLFTATGEGSLKKKSRLRTRAALNQLK